MDRHHRKNAGGGQKVIFLKKNGCTLALLAIGMAFVCIGIARGEAEVVFRRAVNVCMECIGLG